jgi:rSAM/selenodomain-associated transferase 2
MSKPALSIIMPVLNEAGAMALALERLVPMLARGSELIIVDGGSSDGTLAIARANSKVPLSKVISAPRGRALQMNAGARQANADVLLFLHADTLLPRDADALITKALGEGKSVWGRFDVRIAGEAPLLRVVGAFMNLRSRWSGISTGDQAIFMTQAAFNAVAGFPDQPLMEDIEISKRLLKLSHPACLRAQVVTSGRRWESRGLLRTMALMWRLRFAYWRGVSAEKLAEMYR